MKMLLIISFILSQVGHVGVISSFKLLSFPEIIFNNVLKERKREAFDRLQNL